MRLIGTLLLLLVVAPPPRQNVPLIPPLAWGATIDELSRTHTFVRAGGEGRVERFLCSMDSILGAAVEECRLEFLDGKLAGFAVTTQGEGNSRRLLQALLRRHGEGIREDARSIQWMAAGTHISYDEDSAGDACIYWYLLDAPWQK
jgi:hypothetical protein